MPLPVVVVCCPKPENRLEPVVPAVLAPKPNPVDGADDVAAPNPPKPVVVVVEAGVVPNPDPNVPSVK